MLTIPKYWLQYIRNVRKLNKTISFKGWYKGTCVVLFKPRLTGYLIKTVPATVLVA